MEYCITLKDKSNALPKHAGPNLLGIGAPRSGTTWLASILADHPDIFVHPQKELNALQYEDLDERLDEYIKYFQDGGSARIRCDFSVGYLACPRAPHAAFRLLPHAKILVALRDPVDQIQSHYWHLLRQNFHQGTPARPVPDVFEALERYPQLLLEPALYGKHLGRWLEYFSRQQVLVVNHTEVTRYPNAVLDRVCDFLEIDRLDSSTALKQISVSGRRGGVQPRGAVSARLFPAIYVAAAHGPYMWLKRTVGVRRAETLKRILYMRQLSEMLFFKRGYRKLDSGGRRKLYERLGDDIERLTSLGLIDTTSWREVG